ncbi:WXG100 family type VII secretion target [Oryzihumus leptocrescens]|uniref:Type VII secretion system (Wss) protein ESAT-6 n=1 Tax=Oryzihumus leptocrescens TaxID=297536 RepID=A0A542ZHD9_9MICO|nr:WXG100 family type VII secretion target [Oryzihumus leptocrescens]TQL59716.1 type VII secretion system (Wss) protein ESAT-6 [Oryzihumus leptocrescens]
MAVASDGGGGYAGGPKEQELRKIYSFSSQAGPAAKDWSKAADDITALAKSVEATKSELSASWKGDAASAAFSAMDTLKSALDARAAQLHQVSDALSKAVAAANDAQTAYETRVATVPVSVDAQQYTSPGMCKTDGTTVPPKLDQAAYDQAVADQKAKREAAAGSVLTGLNSDMGAATAQVPVTGYHRKTAITVDRWPPKPPVQSGGGSGPSPFTGASTSGTNHYVSSSGWNTQSGDQTIAQVVPSFGSANPGSDFVTSADGTVSGVIPGADVSLPPGVSGVSGGSGSGLTGAAGVGGMLAGGISVGGILRGGSGAAKGGLSGLTSGLRGGLGSVVADGEAALGSAGGRGAAGMVRAGGALSGMPGGAGAAAGEAAGGRGGLMPGGGGGGGMGGSGAGGSAVRGASGAGKYGVPKLDGPGGRGSGAAAEGEAAERAAGSRGSAGSRAAGGTGGTAQGGGAGGGADGRQKRDRDYLTHEDEENWYDDETGASPSVWE